MCTQGYLSLNCFFLTPPTMENYQIKPTLRMESWSRAKSLCFEFHSQFWLLFCFLKLITVTILWVWKLLLMWVTKFWCIGTKASEYLSLNGRCSNVNEQCQIHCAYHLQFNLWMYVIWLAPSSCVMAPRIESNPCDVLYGCRLWQCVHNV